MKAARVYVTLGVIVSLLLAFFFLPLPVSRVHETGLVAVDPDALGGSRGAQRLIPGRPRPARRSARESASPSRARPQRVRVHCDQPGLVDPAHRQRQEEERESSETITPNVTYTRRRFHVR